MVWFVWSGGEMRNPVVHFIHGIHATRKNATSQLAPFFKNAGYHIMVHNYGWAFAMTSGWVNIANKRRAKKIFQHIQPGDSVVAHSNGASIAYLGQRDLCPLHTLILMQPALDNWVLFNGCKRVLIVYNVRDEVVDGARFMGLASSWGDMGRVGYHGKGENVAQWDSEKPPMDLPPYSGHTDFTHKDKLPHWGSGLVRWYSSP